MGAKFNKKKLNEKKCLGIETKKKSFKSKTNTN